MIAFTRTQEDFVCEHCRSEVRGDGYTNHCPRCLWSKHVDIEPGDRAATCGGPMEPIALEGSTPEYVILHRCVQCGYEKRNKTQKMDEAEVLLALAKRKG